MTSMNRTHLFPDCKHKHMIKSGDPHDKVGVQHHLLPIEFYGFIIRIDFYRFSFFGSWSYLSFFRNGMGNFKLQIDHSFIKTSNL